jgi:peptidoglycan hydrolase CwlO-like protein
MSERLEELLEELKEAQSRLGETLLAIEEAREDVSSAEERLWGAEENYKELCGEIEELEEEIERES